MPKPRPRIRLTLAGSIGLVVLVGLGLAGLRLADPWWASAGFSLAVIASLSAAMGAAFAPEGHRASYAGFATFSGAYLLLIFGPGSTVLADRPNPGPTAAPRGAVGPSFLTVPLLEFLAGLRDQTRASQPGSAVRTFWGNQYWPSTIVEVSDERIKIHYDNFAAQFDEWVTIDRLDVGERSRIDFLTVGHSLAAIVVGLVGGGIAVAFWNASRPKPAARA